MIKVLIVEDDPMVALINKKYLEKVGEAEIFGPVTTEKEVISIVKDKKIDLILLDVYLPKESGLNILESLRNKMYLVDVIMITAANKSDEIKKAFAFGAVDYLVKPFEFTRFEEAINKYKLKNKIFNKSEVIEQRDIDSIYDKKVAEELPKGLNKRTLNKVISFLEENSDKVWTLREIAAELQISNVTIKKYMDYLESIEMLKVQLTSGNIGRPELKYSVNIN
ncbi:MAG: response regulator [Clostridium sp.]|nr:response regulator [Clostridium sp.]